jgi:long-chain acyl-CoA synthetase
MVQTATAGTSAAFAEVREFGNTTFPRLFLKHNSVRPGAPALREKDLGIWQTQTWADLKAEVEAIAGGLLAMGFKRGENLALIGENRPRLYVAMIAVQVLGGVPVPLYQDAQASEMLYVFQNAEIRFAIVEDQEQVDKMNELREQHPTLAHIVFDDPRGLRNYEDASLTSYDKLLEQGRQYASSHAGFFQAEIDKGSPEDVAAMFYTSGTTGNPKGVIHTHRNLISMSTEVSRMEKLTADETVLAYLPMAWIGQNIFSYSQWLINGFTVHCPESQATINADMRDIGPTYYFAPPRVFEALLTQVTIRMEDAAPFKRSLFKYFMDHATRVGGRILDGDSSIGFMDRLKYQIGNIAVYGPLRNALGMSKIKLVYTAGEAIGPDLFVFYRALGINMKQLYGSTETAVWVCVQPDGQVSAESVGPPVRGVELKIADSGEVMVRSPGLLREYYKNPQATAEVKDAEGWYRTGDAGYLDQQGHLRIIDRAKDVGKLANGALFAPKFVENKLKFFPFIKEAVVFGAGKDEVMAFVNMDFEACGNWAERRNLVYTGYVDLASRKEVSDMIRDCVEKVNLDLSSDPMMASSQIKRFLILYKSLEADDEELTRTGKVRRGFIATKYQELVDALYSGKSEQYIQTKVRFEDGRVGQVSGTLKIFDAKVFPAAAARKAA